MSLWATALLALFLQRAELVINFDPGGLVIDYIRWYQRIEASHIYIRIRGSCISACTLVLMLPKNEVCVEPNARLGFHLVTVDDKPSIEDTKTLINDFYPKPVREWIMARWPLKRDPITFMDSDTIQALGIFDGCDSTAQ